MTDLEGLAAALAEVGRLVRAAVRAETVSVTDHAVVRTEGGDVVFGVDDRAEAALLDGMAALVGPTWPGSLVLEGRDDVVAVGGGAGPWRYIVDPLDGTRGYLAGKRSAWVLLGAGRDAHTLEDLEVGAAVEIPTARSAYGLVAHAVRGGAPSARDDPLVPGLTRRAVELRPQADAVLQHRFVTVVRFGPGSHGPIGAWADAHLGDLVVFDDLQPCTGGQMAGLASGADAAVFDPRPVLKPGGMCAHPYDLAAIVVFRAAGAVIEALPAGPLTIPLDTTTPVAWAGYASEAIAARLRPPAGQPSLASPVDIGCTHLALEVTDLARSRDFYARFGFAVVHHRIESDGPVMWLSDRTRPFVLVLLERATVGAVLGSWAHIGVGCADRTTVDAHATWAARAGCLVLAPEDAGPPVGYFAIIADPDGHQIEVSHGQEVGLTVARR